MELMTKGEVCRALGVSERTLENYVRTGRFPAAVFLGRRATWAADAVENWKAKAFGPQLHFEPRRVAGVRLPSGAVPLRTGQPRAAT
jgi:excisionase family DNA binding protein